MVEVVHEIDEMAQLRQRFERAARSVALVPTMGALHEGHLSLIRRAVEESDEVVVSIFVNPLQFGDRSDLENYPRPLERDLELVARCGASVAFAPTEAGMFPFGPPEVTVDPGPYGVLLEGSLRPGHMRGVATIVTKLFAIARPARAYFGEKDFEQLILIRHLVRDLGLGIEVIGMPIVREPDGLAMSSRNQRLDPEHRAPAPVLHQALRRGEELALTGGGTVERIEREMASVVAGTEGVALEYATIRNAADLSVPDQISGPLRLLIAARVGPVRLIDNLAVEC